MNMCTSKWPEHTAFHKLKAVNYIKKPLTWDQPELNGLDFLKKKKGQTCFHALFRGFNVDKRLLRYFIFRTEYYDRLMKPLG